MGNTQESREKWENMIRYNNNVMENKDTDIILKTFRESENESENVAVFTLKYNLQQDGKTTPYEVVLGKIQLKKNSENLAIKAKTVREYLLAQLKENSKKQNNYEYCRTLLNTCKKHEIPFIYTEEGIEIVTNDSKNTELIERTYQIQEKKALIELICLNTNKKMDLYESELKIRKKIDEKIKSHNLVDTAMKELKSEKEKNKLIRGKKINDLRKETRKEVIMEKQRNTVVDFLIFDYEKNKGKKKVQEEHRTSIQDYLKMTEYLKKQNIEKTVPHSIVLGQEEEQSSAEKYFRLKEKGIAIDIRKMLEDSQNEALEKQIENAENDEYIEEQNNRDNYINNCKTIFDFIKQGRDVNTQFFYSKRIDGFEELYSIVEEQKDKIDKDGNKVYNSEEILEYLRMKEQIIKTIKLDKKKSFIDYELYTENDILKKFMKFVMKSEVRKDTRKEEEDVLLEMYQEMINEVIKNSQEDVELYNTYAERFDVDVCPISEDIEKANEEQDRNYEQRGR